MNKIYATMDAFQEENQGRLPYTEDLSVLQDTVTAGSVTIPNRLVCQAMEGCDGTADGCPGELTIRRYDRLAKGGAGMIWFEATAVMEEGRANPRQLYLHPENLDDFRREVERIKETGLRENGYAPVVIMQATHSGRYSKPHGKPEPRIAYNNPIFEVNGSISKERIVTDGELDQIGEALVNASILAEKAGFDGVDIKCCHRYLNSELLSAYTREGRYGGSFENRTRLLRESVQGAIESTRNDFLVTSRLNIYDGFPYPYGFGVSENGGTDPDYTEPIRLLQELQKSGMNLVNITMGNPYFNPHVNRPYAKGGYEAPEHPLCGVSRMLLGTAEVKKAVPDMKMICSGLSYLGVAAPHVAAAMVKEGGFDLAGFGRTIFAYPDFAKDILQKGEMAKERLCLACSKCTEVMRSGGTPGCVIRDKETYLPIYQEYCGGMKA